MIETIDSYLLQTNSFESRRRIQRFIDRYCPALKRSLGSLLWAGGWKHLRRFDHRYTLAREGHAISALRYEGETVAKAVPLQDLLTIDRPVTLVTTGPSALDYDWESLRQSGRIIVAVTGGTAFLKERNITPDLLVVTDPDFCRINGFHVLEATGIPLVIEYRCAAAIHQNFPGGLDGKKISIIERVNKWYGSSAMSKPALERSNAASGGVFVITNHPDKLGGIGWSHRLDLGFYPSSTVAFVALQVLVNLGATDIEIVGMVLGGNSSIYANALPSKLEEKYAGTILPAFQEMKVALKGTSVRIKNLSPTCPLPPEIFQFV